MIARFHAALAAVAILVLAACATPQTPGATSVASTPDAKSDLTILISIDGFRPDYVDPVNTPTLDKLAREGVRGALRPSFPSITFPNHYALVTGLRPDRNGMIYNRMEDPERPGVMFTIGDRAVASDPFWWKDGTPIWISAERKGVKTATMFWPGSDYVLQGVQPSKWRAFDQTLMDFSRVDQLLTWLSAPPAERAKFATLYFDIVDTAGHRWGPKSQDTLAAAAQVDAALARLLVGLKARGLGETTNLVIVADHGMAEVADDRVMNLDTRITPEIARVIWDGVFTGIAPVAGKEAEAEAALLGRKEHGECWRKDQIPERFHYGKHVRVPAIICLSDIGWRYQSQQIRQFPGPKGGEHGFDPDDPNMAAVFIASGPAFKHDVSLPKFDNVSVYPLLMKLIGVAPEANDGSLDDTKAALIAP